jgi:hypothetical protein
MSHELRTPLNGNNNLTFILALSFNSPFDRCHWHGRSVNGHFTERRTKRDCKHNLAQCHHFALFDQQHSRRLKARGWQT